MTFGTSIGTETEEPSGSARTLSNPLVRTVLKVRKQSRSAAFSHEKERRREDRNRKIVLVVSDDIGPVLWIGQLLTEAGFLAIPALNCQQAVSFAADLNLHPDVVVINPALPGVSRMLRRLRRTNGRMKIVRLPTTLSAEIVKSQENVDRLCFGGEEIRLGQGDTIRDINV